MKKYFLLTLLIIITYNFSIGKTNTPNDTIANCIIIPNSFNLNENDNKTFHIQILEKTLMKIFKMEIYNRWGENVYTITDINQGWDGVFKGSKLPSGVYLYNINCELLDSNNPNQVIEIKNNTGTISLIR